MGTIVTLPQARRRRRTAVRTGDEATILLFMGVRYVRDHEAPAQPSSRVIVPHHEHAPLETA